MSILAKPPRVSLHSWAVRIIAGEFRGRTILPPQGNVTRPITDRVKQSVFDILTPILPGAVVYDLFAGTGSLGLECLSRGCESVMFFESDRSALSLLRKNIQNLGVGDRSRVIGGDLFEWFNTAKSSTRKANLVFLDPPYRYVAEQAEALRRLARKVVENHLAADGIAVFRHDSAGELGLSGLTTVDSRIYGSMRVEFLGIPKPRKAGG